MQQYYTVTVCTLISQGVPRHTPLPLHDGHDGRGDRCAEKLGNGEEGSGGRGGDDIRGRGGGGGGFSCLSVCSGSGFGFGFDLGLSSWGAGAGSGCLVAGAEGGDGGLVALQDVAGYADDVFASEDVLSEAGVELHYAFDLFGGREVLVGGS